MQPIPAPQGTQDILPGQADAWRWLVDAHRDVAEHFGYRPIETPIFELTEMFVRGTGTGTDVVDKEMYSFIDKGGKDLTLRPEGTPSVVRAVVSAHLEQELRPVRVHYAGPMFRRDRPQKGRYRQFHQVGIEVIGELSAALDAEIIEVAMRFYEALKLPGVELVVNSLGDLEDRKKYRQQLVEFFTPMEASLCADCRRRLQLNPLRLLDCKIDAEKVATAPLLRDILSAENAQYFETVQFLLNEAGIKYSVNDRLVRGLDYYGQTTFEFWHSSLSGSQNALGGGGRYDGLAEVLGFSATAGAGYALGVERILLAAQDAGVAPEPARYADVVVAPLGPTEVEEAAAVARHMRADGIKVVLDASPRKLDKKLRDADRQGATVVAVIGEEERVEKMVSLRHLPTKRQERVTRHEAPEMVKRFSAEVGSGDDDE